MIALLDTSKDPKAIAADVAAVWRAPIGAASPLWLMFAGAATAGMAFWWMNRWRVAPTNLEAVLAPELPAPEPEPMEAPVVEAAAETVEVLVESPIVETVEAVEEVVEAAPEPVLEASPEPVIEAAPEPVVDTVAEVESAPKPKAAPKGKAKSADA